MSDGGFLLFVMIVFGILLFVVAAAPYPEKTITLQALTEDACKIDITANVKFTNINNQKSNEVEDQIRRSILSSASKCYAKQFMQPNPIAISCIENEAKKVEGVSSCSISCTVWATTPPEPSNAK